jgi:hypothetical protein
MTFSASEPAAGSDRLVRSLMLYRDLSVVLLGRIEQLKAKTIGDDAEICKDAETDLKSYRRILLSVFDAEASLDQRSSAGGGGAGVELDLDAARADILERLGLRAAEG